MPSFRPDRRRVRIDQIGRIALACGVAVFGVQSITFSVAQVTAKTRPALAYATAPYDGRIAAANAATLISDIADPAARHRAKRLARDALRRDPTTVLAATTLGLGNVAEGDVVIARRLLAYAQMLSRRDLQTQLWSIEDAAARGDVPGALRWYDIALRTKPQMSDVLFPVLTKAARDAAIRVELVRVLAARPPWANDYIGHAAGQKDDPQNMAALFLAMRHGGVAVPAAARSAVVNTLLNAGNVDQAWRYYTLIRPGADRRRSRDPDFSAMLETPALFDWTTVNDGGIATSIQRARDGGVFEFAAPASIGGPLLEQVQVLSPGRHRLSGHSNGIEQDVRSLPYWVLACRNNRREIARAAIPNSASAGGMFGGKFMIPSDCPVQVLTFFAQPSDSIGGVSGQLDRVAVTPADR